MIEKSYTDEEIAAIPRGVPLYSTPFSVPIHSEAVAYGERAAGTVTIRWRYELIEGAWDRKGVLMFYSTVIEGAASYVDAILSLGKVFDRINENRQGNRGDGNE